MNDKRPTIDIKDFFNKKTGYLKKIKGMRFWNKWGYVSYLRGNHPFKFPKNCFQHL